MSDNAFWCTLILGVLGLVVSAIAVGMVIDAYRVCRYINAGYTRQMLPGHNWPVWVRKEDPK